MAFTHGKETAILVNEFALTAYFNNVDMSRDVDAPESTTFGDSDREYITGLRGGTLSTSGFWDNTAVLGADVVLAATLGQATARIVTYGPEGLAKGDIVYTLQTHTTNYSISSPVDGITSITADFQSTAGFDRGFSFHDLTAETTTGNSSPGIDNTTSSANGGVGQLHVTAISGTTPSLTVDIADSTDNAIFADIVNFTAVTTTPSSQRIVDTGTVNRYLRAEWTITGTTPSYTFTVNYARR